MGNATAGTAQKDAVNVCKDSEYDGSSLDLSHLHLSNLPPDLGSTSIQFVKLLLFNNHLKDLNPLEKDMHVVPSVKYLRHLDVSFNALVELPACFGELAYLKYLDVGYNNIEEISYDLLDELTNGHGTSMEYPDCTLRDLKVFKARYNKLADFPELHKLTLPDDVDDKRRRCGLKVLDLSGNELVKVPELQRFTDLEELHLQYNLLESLAGLEAVSPDLIQLDISHNRLEILPSRRLVHADELKKEDTDREKFKEENPEGYSAAEEEHHFLKELREQDLEAMEREEIQRALGHKLRELNMCAQEEPEEDEPGVLTTLMSSFSGEEPVEYEEEVPALKYNVYYTLHWATFITTLNLSNMKLVNDSFCEPHEVRLISKEPGSTLKADDALSKLHHVTDLDLSINNLEVFPAGIAKMLRLTNLNLSHNKLVKADQISALHKLQVIDLSNNCLIGIPVQISHMINVKRLRLNNNNLRQLPNTIKDLVNLQELNLNSNLLASLPFELGALRLQHFSYFDNERLENPPIEIQAQGPEAVLAYMRARIKKSSKKAANTSEVLYVELWGKEGEIGSIPISGKTKLKDVRQQIDLMVDEAPDRYSFVHSNRAIAEAAEERELAIDYLPMIQLRDDSARKQVSVDKQEVPEDTKEFHAELIRQLRLMHMHKKFEFTVKEGQTHQVFSLES